MQPHLLFDKSFLQQLTVDESVWLDAFFRTVITPTFYTETLADLSKSTRAGRSPEDEVRIIAEKTPTMHSAPVLGHVNLCMAELRGLEIPVDGAQIPTPGGRPVASEGKRGVVFRPAAETEAFRRWQRERFYEIERDFAIDWRRTIQELDLAAVARAVQKMGLYRERAGSLQAAYEIARSAVDAFDFFNRNFRLLALFLGVEPNVMREAARAARRGCPNFCV